MPNRPLFVNRRRLTTAVVVTLAASPAFSQQNVGLLSDGGEIVGWGSNDDGQLDNIPQGSFLAVSAGTRHSVAIREDSSLVDWGQNDLGQLDGTPFGTFLSVDAGSGVTVAVRSDNRLVAWGSSGDVSSDLPSGSFRAASLGLNHGTAIRGSDRALSWGSNSFGQQNGGPFDEDDETIAVAAGGFHSVAILRSGRLVDWGDNSSGQLNNTPSGTFTAVAGGLRHTVALRASGEVIDWGNNSFGQLNGTPTGTFVATDAGGDASSAIRPDGSIASWGSDTAGQISGTPAGTFTAVSVGLAHSLALRARTQYSGDLLITGTGLTANLNRSVRVGGDVTIDTTATLYNNPVLDVGGRLSFSGSGASVANPDNGVASFSAGSLKLDGAGLTIGSAGFERATVYGDVVGDGTLTIAADGQARIGGGAGASRGFMFVQGTGPSRILSPDGFVTTGPANVTIEAGHTLEVDAFGGFLGVGDRDFENGGRVEVLGNRLDSNGPAELHVKGTAVNALAVGNFFTGTVNYTPGQIVARDGVLRFDQGIEQRGGNMTVVGGTVDVFGDINNNSGGGQTGSIVVTGGGEAVFYDDITNSGTIRVSAAGTRTSAAVFLGSLSGNGVSGGGDVFIEGDLRPGFSPAVVEFGGDLFLGSGSATEIELFGLDLGEFDRVEVAGDLTVAGRLDVTAGGGVEPLPGDEFAIFSHASRSGTFDQVSDDLGLPGLRFDIVYGDGEITLEPVRLQRGDANFDGVVNLADFGILRGDFGDEGRSAADFNLDGVVNLADFGELRANFGDSIFGGSVAAAGDLGLIDDWAANVPEPAAMSVLAANGLGLMRRR